MSKSIIRTISLLCITAAVSLFAAGCNSNNLGSTSTTIRESTSSTSRVTSTSGMTSTTSTSGSLSTTSSGLVSSFDMTSGTSSTNIVR